MPEILYHSMAVGVVDADKLHRVDLERMRLAAEEQTNLVCDVVGKAFLRPGLQHIGMAHSAGYQRLIPFYAGELQGYGLCLTANALKILDGDAFVSRPAVTTAVVNGDFTGAGGWTLGTAAGTSVSYVFSQFLRMAAFGRGARATARQEVSVTGANIGKEHGLRIDMNIGTVRIRVGSTLGGQEYVRETPLRRGFHSLAFIPTGNFFIEFSMTSPRPIYINAVTVEPAGDVVLPTIWAEDDLQYIRHDQSLDVMFLACEGRMTQRIETRGDNSFSVCDFITDDGPFALGQVTGVKLKPNVTEGEGNLDSNIPFFTPDHVGTLFRVFHEGQKIDTYVSADGEFSPTIMVTGINEPDYNERGWSYTISGTWAGTLKVQRSFDGDDVEFHNFRKASGTADQNITANVANVSNDDNEDNAIAYYRIGFEPGTYVSGTAHIEIFYNGGGGFGVCHVGTYVSPTQVNIDVIKPFKGTTFSDNWREGAWSEARGWPTSLAFHEGRLCLAGYDAFWGSVSDAYESFDEDYVGDAGPLLRSIALGGRNTARWLVSMGNLMLGTSSLIASVRGSSLDEIMTPENFGIRKQDKVGAARVSPALLSDDRALFVESEGRALFELTYASDKGKYRATEFSRLTTNLFKTGVTDIAVQNRPDQRIWITTGGSDTICIVFNPGQEVVAHVVVALDSPQDLIESVMTLPGTAGQDRVLMSVRRVVNGVTTRRIERMALDLETVPAAITKCLDAHVVFGAGNATVSLPHLIGRTVWAWVDGHYVEDESGAPVPFVVSGAGTITLPSAPAVGGCAGLPYRGRYKSAKLEYGDGGNTSVMRNKQLTSIGLLLADYCRSGVRFGSEFDNPNHPLFNLPSTYNSVPIPSDIILGPGPTELTNPVDAPVTLDARMCIEVTKPASILALVMGFGGHGG